MDGSKGHPKMTAGLDLGDKHSYLCLIDSESGEVIEEGRLRTTPEVLRRRFVSEHPLRIAIETGTHSPDLITKYPAYGGSFSDREIALKKVRGQASGCEE